MAEIGDSPLLNALPDGIILIERDAVSYANEAAAELLGSRTPPSLSGLTPTSLVQLARTGARGTRAADVIERGTPPRWIEVIAEPLEGESVVLVLRDVTEIRNVTTMRRDFVADASHELKTPVASIQAIAETLLRALDDDPGAARRFAEQLHFTAGRLAAVVDDLLDLSRVESEQPELKPLDLGQLAVKESGRIADRAEVRGVELTTEAQPVEVMASRRDIRLAVRNLLENAIEYTEAGGRVTVRTYASGSNGIVEVIDTGRGIPRRDLPRIFERFYRVDDARNRETGGTGLGLSIVRHVADMHGGSVAVESELGVGSTFTVRLPRSA